LNKVRNVTRIVAVVCIAVAFAFGAQALIERRHDGLWKVVQTCLANHGLTGAAFPCLGVNLSDGYERGYVVLRPPFGKPDLILAPTRKIVGVEDPSLQTSEAPNYFEDAWNARAFLPNRRQRPLAHDDVGLAVNSRYTRTQDQLHIHIGCLYRREKQALQALAPMLPDDRWIRIGRPMHGLGFSGRRVAEETLAGVNPFRLAAEGLAGQTGDLSQLMIIVAGVQLADGRDGFVLLASRDDPNNTIDDFSADDLLDFSCSS
jgi:CDP-diacylglycerol pyrophosphatase